MLKLTWNDVNDRALIVLDSMVLYNNGPPISICPVPKGGVYAAQAVVAAHDYRDHPSLEIVEDVNEADCIVDA